MNNYITNGLRKDAPKGVDGICSICNGKTDNIIWTQGVDSNKNLHQERCNRCGQLVDFKNNKVIEDKDIKIYKKRWVDFLKMQQRIPTVKFNYKKIQMKLNDTFFEKITKWLGVYTINEKTYKLLDEKNYLDMTLREMINPFSCFTDYPENFPKDRVEADLLKMEQLKEKCQT